MNWKVTPTALLLLIVGMSCVVLSLWANPVALGRFVPAPTAHFMYFLVGAAVIALSSRVMILERRLGSLEAAADTASGQSLPPNTSLERSREG